MVALQSEAALEEAAQSPEQWAAHGRLLHVSGVLNPAQGEEKPGI